MNKEIDGQVTGLVRLVAVEPKSRPQLEATLLEWLANMGSSDEESELSHTQQRLKSLVNKRKNINRMVAEDIIGWDEFMELRNAVEREESDLVALIESIPDIRLS